MKEKNNKEKKAPSENKNIDQPVDPSNTSHIGQNVEQGIIDTKEGITKQSSQWENEEDAADSSTSLFDKKADDYLKNPSPEDR